MLNCIFNVYIIIFRLIICCQYDFLIQLISSSISFLNSSLSLFYSASLVSPPHYLSLSFFPSLSLNHSHCLSISHSLSLSLIPSSQWMFKLCWYSHFDLQIFRLPRYSPFCHKVIYELFSNLYASVSQPQKQNKLQSLLCFSKYRQNYVICCHLQTISRRKRNGCKLCYIQFA